MIQDFSQAAARGAGPAADILLSQSNSLRSYRHGLSAADHPARSILAAAYRLPSPFNLSTYPGRRRHAKPSLEHTFILLARLYLLHDLSQLTPAQRDQAFATRSLVAAADVVDFLGGLPSGRTARLHGPKVLAVPGKLSAQEYVALANTLAMVYMQVGGEVGSRGAKWGKLAAAMVVMVG